MIGKDWHKSSYSNSQGGACVEARSSADVSSVDMRDTQNRELGHLSLPSGEWTALLASVTR